MNGSEAHFGIDLQQPLAITASAKKAISYYCDTIQLIIVVAVDDQSIEIDQMFCSPLVPAIDLGSTGVCTLFSCLHPALAFEQAKT